MVRVIGAARFGRGVFGSPVVLRVGVGGDFGQRWMTLDDAALLANGPARSLPLGPALRGKREKRHGHDGVDPPVRKTKDGATVVWNTAFTLEWVLTSPPPLHAFLEPPVRWGSPGLEKRRD